MCLSGVILSFDNINSSNRLLCLKTVSAVSVARNMVAGDICNRKIQASGGQIIFDFAGDDA